MINQKPFAYHYDWAHVVMCEGPANFKPCFETEAPPAWAVEEGRVKSLQPLFTESQLNAEVQRVIAETFEGKFEGDEAPVEPLLLCVAAELQEDGDGGLEPIWNLEGGTAEFEHGELLLAWNGERLEDVDGDIEVYGSKYVGQLINDIRVLKAGGQLLIRDRDDLKAQAGVHKLAMDAACATIENQGAELTKLRELLGRWLDMPRQNCGDMKQLATETELMLPAFYGAPKHDN